MSAKGKEEEVPPSDDDDDDDSREHMPDQPVGGQEADAVSENVGPGPPLQTGVGPIYEYLADPENVPSHPSVVSFGKRRSGKSTSLDNWFFHCIQHVPFGVCITRTKANGFWQTRIPEHYVFQGFRTDVLVKLLARQRALIKEHGKDNPITFAFCILDDSKFILSFKSDCDGFRRIRSHPCLCAKFITLTSFHFLVIADQRQIRHTPELNTFFVEGRHLNISVFITSQQLKGIGPMLRGNCDLIFIQPIYNVNERQALYELYAGFMEKKQWFKLMDEVIYSKKLKGHTPLNPRLEVQIMVVEDFDQSPTPQEKFFYWKPVHSDALPPYRLLHPAYWKEKPRQAEIADADGTKPAGPSHPADVLDQFRNAF